MHYRIYIAETTVAAARGGFVEGVDRGQREYYSKCCSFGHVDIGRGGEGVNRALTVANDTWRHVPPPRCAFRGPRVPTNLSSTWRESKSRGTNFEKIIYLVSFSRELFLTRKKGKCIGEKVFFVSNFIKCKKQLKKDHFVGRRTALENKRNNRWYFFPLLLHLI